MSDTAIKVEGLSKRYRIGANQQMYQSLKERLNAKAAAPLRAAKHLLTRNGNANGGGPSGKGEVADANTSRLALGASPSRSSDRAMIWALKDVSFEIKRGEVVGIIGRNGAGKSTLLKILSRITEPTEGYADINGRVGSLLEVGTGFQPELTGRENIFLNGSILGMRHAEIKSKFDEMVAFAEVEKFIDTPVKHYSSGMYVRLAFAVAAHLNPEILLVDEVLAVGDVAFQKKCLGKISDVARDGRTVLFVSHNMAAIQRLCPNSILFDRGLLSRKGATKGVIAQYLTDITETVRTNQRTDVSSASRAGSGEVRFQAFTYTVPEKGDVAGPCSYDSFEITLELVSEGARSLGSVAVTLYDEHGTKLVNADTLSLGHSITTNPGLNTITLKIDKLFLNAGVYTLGLWAADAIAGTFDHVEAAGRIEVFKPHQSGLGETPKSDGVVPCAFSIVR